jgi:DNA-binding CsgD family transcriptional regulator
VGNEGANSTRLVLRDLAEIALDSESAAVFRRDALSRIARFVGADFCSLHTVINQDVLSLTAFGADGAPLLAALQTTIREVTRDEVSKTIGSHRALRDADVMSRSRRERLTFYREYLAAMHVKAYALRAWSTGSGFTFLSIARTGNVGQRFLARATSAVDGFFPVLALGERAHAFNHALACGRGSFDRATLTAAEGRVVSLLERGLTNREIGTLLGISPNTVRNRVASAFRRVGASRRAELVYLLRTTAGSNGE